MHHISNISRSTSSSAGAATDRADSPHPPTSPRYLWHRLLGGLFGLPLFPVAVYLIDGYDGGRAPATTDHPLNPDAGGDKIAGSARVVKLGGAFTLVAAATGAKVTDEDVFRDRWTLLYFGFCRCAEICPNTLRFLDDVLSDPRIPRDRVAQRGLTLRELKAPSAEEALSNPSLLSAKPEGALLPQLGVTFVSVDSRRDSVAEINRFLAPFGKGTVGLTGTAAQLIQCAKAWRVYFSSPMNETEEERLAREARGIATLEETLDDATYQLDHSSAVYLVSPDGKLRDFFFREMGKAAVVDKLLLHLANAYGLDDDDAPK